MTRIGGGTSSAFPGQNGSGLASRGDGRHKGRARQGVATLPQATLCARSECGKRFVRAVRRRGALRRFCSARCRWLAWAQLHPRV